MGIQWIDTRQLDNTLNIPRITVLMSVFNGSEWLGQSISSVLNQTLRDFEFIIINDGSTDGSLKIMLSYAQMDKRIRIISKDNTGLGDSLNRGIHEAKGKWIARLDADDICEPERLEILVSVVEKDTSLVLIGSGSQEIDEYGMLGKTYRYPNTHFALVNNLLSYKPFFSHSSAFYNLEVVRAIGGYRTRIIRAQDRDLWARLSEVGRLASISMPLVKVRQHDAQISHVDSSNQKIDSRMAMISYWIRKYGHIDPVSEDYSDSEFLIFRDWVATRLQEWQCEQYYAFLYEIKQSTRISNSLIVRMMKIACLVFKYPKFVARYLSSYVVGEKLSKSLAKDWIACQART